MLSTERQRLKDHLELSAMNTAKFRQHDMSDFRSLSDAVSHSECRKCQAYVQVNAKPLPNETDIAGTAIALNCKLT